MCVCKKHGPHTTSLGGFISHWETPGQLEGKFEGKTNLSPKKGKPSEYIEYAGHLSVK